MASGEHSNSVRNMDSLRSNDQPRDFGKSGTDPDTVHLGDSGPLQGRSGAANKTTGGPHGEAKVPFGVPPLGGLPSGGFTSIFHRLRPTLLQKEKLGSVPNFPEWRFPATARPQAEGG